MAERALKPGELTRPYRIEHGKKFRLSDFDPADTLGLELKKERQIC